MTIPSVDPALFPPMAVIRQDFPAAAPLDVEAIITAGLAGFTITPGARIAVTAGSRGIAEIARVVKAAVAALRARGAAPFVIPAMGSHGGGTAEGQTRLLAGYGITEASIGAPIAAAMDVYRVDTTAEGVPVFCSREALRADGVVLLNRIKPHTDYGGPLGSGLLKMAAIGLGKQEGANTIHRAAARLKLEHLLPEVGAANLRHAKVLAGIALVENATHGLHHVEVIAPAAIPVREPILYTMARAQMARLPWDELDFLVVDRIGKDITGTGMDPNVIGRHVSGYNATLTHQPDYKPVIRRIFVRALSDGTHGNALGIGLADFTTHRLFDAIDWDITLTNALNSMAVLSVKVPIRFRTDREAIGAALASLALLDPGAVRMARIRDTLSLRTIEVSPACLGGSFSVIEAPRPMAFGPDGNLPPLQG